MASENRFESTQGMSPLCKQGLRNLLTACADTKRLWSVRLRLALSGPRSAERHRPDWGDGALRDYQGIGRPSQARKRPLSPGRSRSITPSSSSAARAGENSLPSGTLP